MGKGAGDLECRTMSLTAAEVGDSVRPAGRKWTDDLVRSELTAFLTGRTAWPRQWEFLAAGRADLVGAMARMGGARRWARELGFGEIRAGQHRYWTDERIEAELRAVLAGKDWPGIRGLKALSPRLHAVLFKDPRGTNFWVERLGLAPRRRQWDDARIRAELDRFLGDRHDWPSKREFQAAQMSYLLTAVYKHGGPERWAGEMGVMLRSHGRARAVAGREI
jgi:hypothetical protein